jgi:hypothetical protein
MHVSTLLLSRVGVLTWRTLGVDDCGSMNLREFSLLGLVGGPSGLFLHFDPLFPPCLTTSCQQDRQYELFSSDLRSNPVALNLEQPDLVRVCGRWCGCRSIFRNEDDMGPQVPLSWLTWYLRRKPFF